MMFGFITLTPINSYCRYTIGSLVCLPIIVAYLWNMVNFGEIKKEIYIVMIKQISFYLRDKLQLFMMIIASIGMMIKFPDPSKAEENFAYNNWYQTIVVLILVVVLYKYCVKNKIFPKLIDYIFGLFYSVLFVSTLVFNPWNWIKTSRTIELVGVGYFRDIQGWLLYIFAILGWTVIFSYGFKLFNRYFLMIKNDGNVPSIITLSLFMLVLWSVVIISYLPGQISYDALRQFSEYEHQIIIGADMRYPLTNHHPYFVTVIFGMLFKFGRHFFGVNAGILTVVAAQVVITLPIYAFITKYVWEKLGNIFGFITLLYFASPVFSTYAVTIDKGTLYYAFCALFYYAFVNFFESIRNNNFTILKNINFVVSSFLIYEFRNDSKYVIAITAILLIMYALFKQSGVFKVGAVLACLVIPIISWNAYTNHLKVIPSAISEALTIPTRQLSYTYLNDSKSFSGKDKNIIDKITPTDKILEAFDLNNGDYLKNLYPVNTMIGGRDWKIIVTGIKNHKITINTTNQEKADVKAYLKVWIKQGMKHPIDYISIYLGANSMYFNPSFGLENHDALFMNNEIFYFPVQTTWYHEYKPVFKNKQLTNNYVNAFLSLPTVSIIVNTAFPFISVLLGLSVILRRKQYYLLFTIIPVILMVGAYSMSSINGYSRYVIGVTAVIPIMFAYLRDKLLNPEEKING